MKSKKVIISVIILFACLSGIVITWLYGKSIDSNSDVDSESSAVLNYLSGFMNKNYGVCDSYVSNDGFKITDFQSSNQALLNGISSSIYTEFFNLLIDSIDSIEVVNINVDELTNYKNYELNVTYTPYKVISELNVDSDELNNTVEKYMLGDIDKSEMEERLNSYYINSFISCFVLSDSEKVNKIVNISEGYSDGLYYVYGVKEFIQNIIPTEMYQNLDVYETNINAKVTSTIGSFTLK